MAGDILVGQDLYHPGHGLCLRYIDPQDLSMGVGREEYPAFQLALRLHIVGKEQGAGDPLDPMLGGGALTYPA